MQSPIIVFDHIRKVVTVAQPGPTYDKTVAEVAAAQAGQVTSSGDNPAR